MNTVFAAMSMSASAQQSACAAFSCPDAANGMIIILGTSLLVSIFVLAIAVLALLSLLADSCSGRRAA